MRTTIATCLITCCLCPIAEAAQDVGRWDRPWCSHDPVGRLRPLNMPIAIIISNLP